MNSAGGNGSLHGCAVLVIEDEFFQARETRQTLEQAGAQVIGPFASGDGLEALLDRQAVDLALIDINLGEGPSFDAAYLLRARGIPFVIVTGYDAAAMPQDLADVPAIAKPVDSARLMMHLNGVFASR